MQNQTTLGVPLTDEKKWQPPGRKARTQIQSPPTLSVSESGVKRDSISVKLKWRWGERAPREVYRESDAVVCGNRMYLIPADNDIYVYDATKGWSELPNCPHEWSSLAIINNLLTTIGGGILTTTNKLFSLTGEGDNRRWTEEFPPMPTKRSNATSLCIKISLVVIGGDREIFRSLATVEVMNTETRQWSTAASLYHPVSIANASAAICNDRIYLINRFDKSVYACFLSTLLEACISESSSSVLSPSSIYGSIWERVMNIPVCNATCVSLNGMLLAVGGNTSPTTPTKAIRKYNPDTDFWTIIGRMSTARAYCFAAAFPTNQLVIVGGISFPNVIDSVEIADLA